MPITKKLLCQIAGEAWQESFENGNCDVERLITGNHENIYNYLESLARKVSLTLTTDKYECYVENLDRQFTFCVVERDCYDIAFNREEDDSNSIIADEVEDLCGHEEHEDDAEWLKVKNACRKQHDGAFWVTDHLQLALNYGNCLNEGKHEKMSDDDWQFYCDNFNNDNDEENCYMLYKKLDAERLDIYWKLEYNHNK